MSGNVGQAGDANVQISPTTDGNGSGMPASNVISNIAGGLSTLATAIGADVIGVNAVNQGQAVQTAGVSTSGAGAVVAQQPASGIGLSVSGIIPLALIVLAIWAVFRIADE